MQKRGINKFFALKKNNFIKAHNLFLKTKKADVSATTIVSLILVIVFFVTILYLILQKIPLK